MERMDEDLFDKVGKTKSYTEEECKEVVKNILVALDCIHSKGYAHLDLKLENVMLKPNSMTDVRLIDFGFAKKIGNSAYEIVVNPYSIAFGSPGYLSPEMKDYRRGNGKSDIWALGCIVYEIFTDYILKQINSKKSNVVFILWGKYARDKKSFIDDSRHCIIESAHPSPYSAHNGFFGSKPFSKTNCYLIKKGLEPIFW